MLLLGLVLSAFWLVTTGLWGLLVALAVWRAYRIFRFGKKLIHISGEPSAWRLLVRGDAGTPISARIDLAEQYLKHKRENAIARGNTATGVHDDSL